MDLCMLVCLRPDSTLTEVETQLVADLFMRYSCMTLPCSMQRDVVFFNYSPTQQ